MSGASADHAESGTATPLLVFALDRERVALAAAQVREVLRAALPVSLPNAPAIVRGVLDVRGGLVPLVDLRHRLGLPERPLRAEDHLVVASAGPRVVAFAVDRALDVVSVAAEAMRDIRDVAAGTPHVAGVARLDDGLVVIHDLRRFLDADEVLALDRALAAVRG